MTRRFAHLTNNIVDNTIVADDAFINSLSNSSEWVEYWKDAKGEAEKRYNPAALGLVFDSVNNAFLLPQPFPSWVQNDKFFWEAPIKKPDDTETHFYYWNEEDKQWVMAEIPPEEED